MAKIGTNWNGIKENFGAVGVIGDRMNRIFTYPLILMILMLSFCFFSDGCVSVEDENAQLWDMKQDTLKSPPATYTGVWIEHWKNGRKSAEYHYKNGIKQGKEIHWYLNGHKQSEVNYINGLREGKYIEWTKYGELDIVCYYKHGMKNGKYITYHKNARGKGIGQKYCEGTFKDGKRDGLFMFWQSDGRLMGKVTFKNDKKEGEAVWWHNGHIYCKEHYKNGILVDPSKKQPPP